MGQGVFIGAQELNQKDELVLRALVRLLDGGGNTKLRYSEDLSECDIIFGCEAVAKNPLPSAKTVRVTVRHLAQAQSDAALATSADGELSVVAPLRMSNVMAVVQSILQRATPDKPHDAMRGWLALYNVLSARMKGAERRRCVVPMHPGQELVVDFMQQKIYTAIPNEMLLSGRYGVGEPRRVSPVEEEIVRTLTAMSLRHLLWSLALRLAHANAPAPKLPDSYRLLRWPDTVALSRYGYPRLAALLTSRSMTCEQASAACGLPLHAVSWFLDTCLTLGVAEKTEAAPHSMVTAKPGPASAKVATGWLGQLKSKLKLW